MTSNSHKTQNDSDLDEIWEDSLNSTLNNNSQEAFDEVKQLTATHLNSRKFTRQIKEINLNVKYSTPTDQKQLASQLKQLRTVLMEINQKFLYKQKTQFEAKQKVVKQQLKTVFETQVDQLDQLQGKVYIYW